MGSSVRNPAMRNHMLVQNGQDDCECCWIWYRLIRVWRVWCHWQLFANSFVELPWIVCQCLRKELWWGECVLPSVLFIGITSYCDCRSRIFFLLLMMRCSRYVQASIIHVRLLRFPRWLCGLLRWSCCIEVLLVNKWYLLCKWVGGDSGSEVVSCSQLVFYRVLVLGFLDLER